MTPDCFLDTNVLFYAAMGRFSQPLKYRLARRIIAETHFAVSGQVLQEFYVNVTRKSDKPFTSAQAIEWLKRLVDRPCADHTEDLNDGQLYGSVRAINPFKPN